MNRKMFADGEVKLEDTGHLTAAFAQLNVIDSDGDITVKGAFPSKNVVLSAYGHTSWDGALPLGRGSIKEDGDWAVFDGQFFLDTTHGRDAFATVKGLGELAEYSYGFNILDSRPVTVDGKSTRELRSLDVFEVSPVLKGAGVGTHTRALKSGALGPGASLVDEAAWNLGNFAAFLERVDARKALRDDEGRKLSRVQLATLADCEEAGAKYLAALRELRTLPEEAAAAKRRLAMLIAEAEALGVTV